MTGHTYYAHSANDVSKRHPLKDHLRCVADLAGRFASTTRWREEASFAGILHDLGKYADRFQARLRGEDSGLDHWSPGAWLALKSVDDGRPSVAAAIAVEGHHIGLQPVSRDMWRRLNPANLAASHPLRLALSDPDPKRLLGRARSDGLTISPPAKPTVLTRHDVADMLDIRMLFSCLVDADFLDTEAHFAGDEHGKHYRVSGPALAPDDALRTLDAFVARLGAGKPQKDPVANARHALWQAVSEAAQAGLGPCTLTAPTGSGKTLAMLKFALEQAAHHGLKRIIIAVPFLTVIEQTAAIYRAVFADTPEHYLLEHHSLAGTGNESSIADAVETAERQRRLLAENWDAPIVLTTNVQLLESLFSNRPSACRKLHNLMESVILFDEAQGLPRDLAVPTLAALSHLCASYRCSVVFATATQPAFSSLHESVEKGAPSGWQPKEAVPGHRALFTALRRVEVRWPSSTERTPWTALAKALDDQDQALCVLNLKRHGLGLLDMLEAREHTHHLSTNLCAEHRKAVMERVRRALRHRDPCRLISTQCVEAGVDVDFPCVYRALAPLESIAQAAGRCNREGRMSTPGEVIIFEPADDVPRRRLYPTQAYYQAAELTRCMLIEEGELDICDPDLFTRYYRRLYDLTRPETENKALDRAITARDFPEIARLYRLIGQDAIQVLVPWSERIEQFDELRRQAEEDGIDGRWIRRAQGLCVNLFRPARGQRDWDAYLIPAKLQRGGESREWFILEESTGARYDDTLGLILPQGDQVYIA